MSLSSELALRSSVEHLRTLVAPLDDETLESSAYPREWRICDVLSHIGSGAVIIQRRVEDALADRPTPDDFAPGVWEVWNAKGPRAQADDAVVADRALLDRIAAVSEAEGGPLQFALGPVTLDLAGFVALRLNEHALHTWDIDVALDPKAAVTPEAAEVLVDNLGLIARFTARPTGKSRVVQVRTTDPVRLFTITLEPGTVSFEPAGSGSSPDLELPAEAFARLLYGRLDPEHTPAVTGDTTLLDELRLVYPGP
jgi:uncharacterized protein (TIGR03083 family)